MWRNRFHFQNLHTFPTSNITRITFTSCEAENEVIISISEFCSFIFFLLLRGPALQGKLIAYTGDNTNVVIWIESRKAGNERARFLLRILARFEQTIDCRTYPLFISTFNNTDCDNLTRLPEDDLPEYAKGRNWVFVNPSDIFKFYTTESFDRRVPTLPFDSDDRIAFIYQLAEKRTYRSIPRLRAKPFPLLILGKGTGVWDQLLSSEWGNMGTVQKWPSEPDFCLLPPHHLQETLSKAPRA